MLQLFSSVSEAYFKYFICLQTYIASVASRCFKSRSGIAHVVEGMRAVPTRGLVARALHGHVNPRRRWGCASCFSSAGMEC
jgi:hypothetical protein